MPAPIFLARTEEQQKFREVLSELPGKRLVDSPFIFLFYGEGGMGKTTLLQRLQSITQQEAPHTGLFKANLFVDWGRTRDSEARLQVGHDNIEPEAVLLALAKAMRAVGWLGDLQALDNISADAVKLLNKVDRELLPRPERRLDPRLSKLGATDVRRLLRHGGGDELTKIAREWVQHKLPKTNDYDLFVNHEAHMARELGSVFKSLSQDKPLIVFFDTYEVVDRQACDLLVRDLIRNSGGRIVWVIGGRKNLATGARGYPRDFAEGGELFAKSLNTFGASEVAAYFEQYASPQTLTRQQAEQIATFTLGIPYVVHLAASMFKSYATMEQIIAPAAHPSSTDPHNFIVNKMSERFLVHCVNTDEGDRQTIEIMALMRRNDPAVLREMLPDANDPDVEARLKGLQERHGFVLTYDGQLNEKLASFLHRRLLLSPLMRDRTHIQAAVANARSHIGDELKKRRADFDDTADFAADVRANELVSDWIHFSFWKSEEAGWKALIPNFLEALQYNAPLSQALVQIAATFKDLLDETGKRRLKLFQDGANFSNLENTIQTALQKLNNNNVGSLLQGGNLSPLRDIAGGIESSGLMSALDEKALETFQELFENLGVKNIEKLSTSVNWEEVGQIFEEQHLKEWIGKFEVSNAQTLTLSNTKATRPLQAMLDELDTFEKGKWLEGGNRDELLAILRFQRGKLYARQGHFKRALQALREAQTKLSPKNQHLRQDLSAAFEQAGWKLGVGQDQQVIKSSEALSAFDRAVELNPDNANAWRGRGLVQFRLGELDQALVSIQKALDLTGEYPDALIDMADVYRKQGRHEDALAAYGLAEKLIPDSERTYLGMGKTLVKQERYAEALSFYQKVLAINPNSDAAYLAMGRANLDQDELEDARVMLDKALALNPQNALARYQMGKLLVRLGEWSQAVEQNEQAIRFGETDGWLGLGNTYLLQKLYPEALQAFRQGQKEDPSEGSYTVMFVEIFLRQNQLPLAEQKMRLLLIPMTITFAHAWEASFVHGLLRGLQGRSPEAISLWRKGLDEWERNKVVWTELIDQENVGRPAIDQMRHTTFLLAAGNADEAIAKLKQLISKYPTQKGSMAYALSNAELLARCKPPPDRIDDMIALLQEAISS